MRNARQQSGAVVQQLAHLLRHAVETARQLGEFIRTGFRQRLGQFARPHLTGRQHGARQRHRDAAHQQQCGEQAQKGAQSNHGNRGQRQLDGIAVGEKPHPQIVPAQRNVQPRGRRARHSVQRQGVAQTLTQCGLDLAAKGKRGCIGSRADIDGGQAQAVAACKFTLECRTRLRRQLHPGLRRQHNQAGKIICRTLCHRHDQGAIHHPERRRLKHDESQRQCQRGTGEEGMRHGPDTQMRRRPKHRLRSRQVLTSRMPAPAPATDRRCGRACEWRSPGHSRPRFPGAHPESGATPRIRPP